MSRHSPGSIRFAALLYTSFKFSPLLHLPRKKISSLPCLVSHYSAIAEGPQVTQRAFPNCALKTCCLPLIVLFHLKYCYETQASTFQ
ncbi:hypothetical protein HBI70_035890 [Parastagonospora nodorum]|nr:hypothetical protein HBH51_075250 [Parastagonospora nodorum]KAH4177787.1 hypothetical protein HBH43_036270 [Parastagonospora nodorum]KAH4821708.1 hypothetical protein HBH61_020000 [Parastagonospora nodorum]KAH4992112.1 hypothetical protein HBI76_050370 [Parastagonospora nodorum]KAH5285544.1 hypothetical protein HBI70_035890 [Parastagonospora nodorum]